MEAIGAQESTVSLAPRERPRELGRQRGVTNRAPPGPREQISRTGALLAFCGLLIAGSASRDFRIPLGSLLIHPVNIALLPLVLLIPARVHRVPLALVGLLAFFTGAFAIVAGVEPGGLDEIVKIAAASLTVLVAALAIQSQADLRAIGTTLAISAAFIGARAYSSADLGGLQGLNPLSGIGNKNAYSLYALPGLLMAVHILTSQQTSKWLRLVLVASAVAIIVTLLMTANRSGWLGAALIAAIYGVRSLRGRRNLFLFAGTIALSTYIVFSFGNTDMVRHRVRQTQVGSSSDGMRADFVRSSLEVALENPIIGASPQGLTVELGRRSRYRSGKYETHNLFAMIIGGGGLLLSLPFALLGVWFWRRPRQFDAKASPAKADAHFLLRAMVLTLVLRGMFTSEVIYNPAAALGLGAAVGLCNIHGLWRKRAPVRRPLRTPGTLAPRTAP